MWPGRAVRRGTPKQRMVFGPPVSRSTIVLVLLQLFSTSRVTAVRRLAEWRCVLLNCPSVSEYGCPQTVRLLSFLHPA